MKTLDFKKVIVFLTINFLFLTLNLFAQAPQSFKYQSVVRDANGNAMQNQAVDFRISILQGSSSGTPVYIETFSTTTNNFGLINLNIGTGTVLSGTFANINWGADNYFMQVELDPDGNGFQLMGVSQLMSVPYALNAVKADNVNNNDTSATNEIQVLSQIGTSVNLSNGGGTISVADNDNDTTNEIQAISFSGDTLYLSNGSSVYLGNYSNLWQQNGNDIYYNNGYVGVGLTDPHGKLIVQGDASIPADSAIFEVRNKDGQVVFAVYQEGVRVYVDDTGTKAISSKGGFAVGGYNATKSLTNEYLRVTPDSVRVYIQEDNGSKAISSKGGFAVGGFNATKSYTNSYLRVTDDSTRIWTGDSISGFGIRNLGTTETSYMQLTPQNYFIGHNSGINTTIGLYNNFFGYNAGLNNTEGFYNTFIGYESGYSNIGYDPNVTVLLHGMENTFVGYQSGKYNIMGEDNTFLGSQAGYSNTNGRLNTFIGTKSGFNNTTGYFNLFVGFNSGHNNIDGRYNTFMGSSAGHNNIDGEYNTYIGMYAGVNIHTGNNNTCLGSSSGGGDLYSANGTGSNNVYLGYESGAFNYNGTGNVFIGFQAGRNETGSNKLYISNSNTSTPLIYGDFSTNKVTIKDVLKLTPTTEPTNPSEGEIFVKASTHHIYCYLNGIWVRLD